MKCRNAFKSLPQVVVAFSVTYFSVTSYAQYLTGPVASSLGSAGRAAVDDGEQVVLNPALAVHGSTFTSEVFYIDGYNAKDEHDNIAGFGLTDNTEGLIASGGYYFAKKRSTYPVLQTLEQEYHQASFARFLEKHFSAGLAITYLDSNVIGGTRYKQWDANLGFHYNPDPNYAFGLVFYNLAERDLKAPVHVQNQDSIFLASHFLFLERFRCRVDIGQQQSLNPKNKFQFQFGLESKVSEFLVTRVGFEKDDLIDRDSYTLGLAFDGPRIKFDYFYRHNLDYSDGSMHGVDMRLPFW